MYAQTLVRSELRSCLWFEYRRWRFHGRVPDAAAMRNCAALVREMRTVS